MPTLCGMKASNEAKPKAERGIESVQVGGVPVKIYERTRRTVKGGTRTVWEVADYSQGRRRLLGFKNHLEARSEAKRIATVISTGNAAGADITNRDAASFGRALDLLRPTGTPIELVAAQYAEAFKILGGNRIVEAAKEFVRRNPTARPARTVQEAAAELLELQTKRAASGCYLQDLKTRLSNLSQRFVSVDVGSVATADIQAWLDGMAGAPRSVKNYRDAANALFKFCESRNYIGRGENPVAATEKIQARKGGKITIFAPEELAKLLAAAPDLFKPIIAIQAFAGLRSAEVMRLDWQDVKIERRHIEVAAEKSKTAQRRLAPITENLAEWLAEHAKGKGRIWPFRAAYFREHQTKISEAAKVDWKSNALRHSFISYRVAAIQDVPKVALEAGNSPAMIFANYRELVTPQDAQAWFAVAPEGVSV